MLEYKNKIGSSIFDWPAKIKQWIVSEHDNSNQANSGSICKKCCLTQRDEVDAKYLNSLVGAERTAVINHQVNCLGRTPKKSRNGEFIRYE